MRTSIERMPLTACDFDSDDPPFINNEGSFVTSLSLSCGRPWRHWLLCLGFGLIPAFLTWLSMSAYSLHYNRKFHIFSPIPDMPLDTRSFEWNYTFTDLRSPESEEAWKSITPFGQGHVFVPSSYAFDLPPGEETVHGQIYTVALYHQLHCLRVIRRDYFDLLEGVWNNEANLQKTAKHQIENSHNRHCMDYIRQTLECSADMTLEWMRTEQDGRRFQVDGMGIKHMCKSQTAIRRYMEEQQAIVGHERKFALSH